MRWGWLLVSMVVWLAPSGTLEAQAREQIPVAGAWVPDLAEDEAQASIDAQRFGGAVAQVVAAGVFVVGLALAIDGMSAIVSDRDPFFMQLELSLAAVVVGLHLFFGGIALRGTAGRREARLRESRHAMMPGLGLAF